MKTIVITGCSSGYGKATAELFWERGWNVVATMRRPELGAFGIQSDRLLVTALDVTDPASIERAFTEAIGAFGGIDVLVNNAGIGLLSAFEATPAETVRELFETNTFGVMAATQAIIPHMRESHMRERRSGTIVNVTSSACFAGMPLVAPYTASKFATEGFSESLVHELASVGVRVKLVEPGYGPDTKFTANGMARMAGLIPEAYQAYSQQILGGVSERGQTTTDRDVAEGVYSAATDNSDRLRFPAGPDAHQLANARWNQTDEEFLSGMRALFRMRM